MSFDKAAQKAPTEIISTYKLAKLAYAEAARKITKLRLLGDHPNATDEQIIAYARGRKEFAAASKLYSAARTEFLHAMKEYQATAKAAHTEKDEDVLSDVRDYSMRELSDMQRESDIAEEFASGKYADVVSEVKERLNTREQFSRSENDPTLGDFDPLP